MPPLIRPRETGEGNHAKRGGGGGAKAANTCLHNSCPHNACPHNNCPHEAKRRRAKPIPPTGKVLYDPRGGEDVMQPILLVFLGGGLGGFTTFSAFSLDSVLLWERGEALLAAGYVAASVMGSILALMAGFALVRVLA
jgi:hypothetical protein